MSENPLLPLLPLLPFQKAHNTYLLSFLVFLKTGPEEQRLYNE
jgi:hypothetical protein